MFCTVCHVVFDWESLKIDNGGNVHNAHYFEWMTSQNNKVLSIEETACGNIEDIYRNLISKLDRKMNMMGYNHFKGLQIILRFVKSMFQINRIFNGEIIDLIRNTCIKDNFENYRIQYLDNQISEKNWKSKIAKDTINNEKYKSLIEILEMYITVTSDLIRQIAFESISDYEFKNNYNQFVKHFIKSANEILDIFGGDFNKRINYLVFEYTLKVNYGYS